MKARTREELVAEIILRLPREAIHLWPYNDARAAAEEIAERYELARRDGVGRWQAYRWVGHQEPGQPERYLVHRSDAVYEIFTSEDSARAESVAAVLRALEADADTAKPGSR